MRFTVCTRSADARWTEDNIGCDEVEIMNFTTLEQAERLARRLNTPAVNDGYQRANPFYVRRNEVAA